MGRRRGNDEKEEEEREEKKKIGVETHAKNEWRNERCFERKTRGGKEEKEKIEKEKMSTKYVSLKLKTYSENLKIHE
jgi:hypothetical protein